MKAEDLKPGTVSGAKATDSDSAPLLVAESLRVWYPVRHGLLQKPGWIRAVNGVSLQVDSAETLAVVGESGCGKTSLGRSLVMLERPAAGTVTFLGRELTSLTGRQLRKARRHLQMIFQDP